MTGCKDQPPPRAAPELKKVCNQARFKYMVVLRIVVPYINHINAAPICTKYFFRRLSFLIFVKQKNFKVILCTKEPFLIDFCEFYTCKGPLKIGEPRLQPTLPVR